MQNPDNPEYGTDGGNDTTDKVFLLSIDEATRYFASDKARMAEATDYAKEQGIYVSGKNDNSWWWLRSLGRNNSDAAYVDIGGSVRNYGSYANDGESGVRPAMWVNIGE